MNPKCDIVQDLLALYAEDMASKSSMQLVESHLARCDNCRNALMQLRQELPVPADTQWNALRALKKQTQTRLCAAVFVFVSSVLLLLFGWWVYSHVPVWLPAEEAVLDVQMTQEGVLEIRHTDSVYGTYSGGNTVVCMGLRCLSPERRVLLAQSEKMHSLYVEPGEPLWYAGSLVGYENVLLYAENALPVPEADITQIDWSLGYMFWGTLALGVMLLTACFFFRRKMGSCYLWHIGILLLLCAVFTLFVTDGNFAVWSDNLFSPFGSGGLSIRLVSVGILTGLGWILQWSLKQLIGRRKQHETEL